MAPTPANLRALKRQRTAVEPEPATIPLHPPPTPEIVILRLIELPKLLVVHIVHLLEFHELASLDQLGHGDKKKQNLPKLVEALKGKKVVQVSAGANHSLVLTKSGEVFSFGAGWRGKLGHGDLMGQDLPKLVEALKGKKVVQVSAGGNHSLVLTESGNVFSFGSGYHGQLGHGDRKQQHLPKLVEELKGKKVVQVSAGGGHSLVLMESGDVFSFGDGRHGKLGHGDEEYQPLPKLVEVLKGKTVVQVSAGSYHSLVLTESGDVFSFGDGEYGALGHGDEEHQPLPKLVEALKGKKVVEVQAGGEQSVVLIKDERILVSGQHFRKINPEWDEDLAYDEDGEDIEGYDVPRYSRTSMTSMVLLLGTSSCCHG